MNNFSLFRELPRTIGALLVFGGIILLLMACGGRQPAPELRGIDGWINSEPLTLAELRGKVVLIDFWTYTCVNCIRTFPYLREWHEKYTDYGLVIIGVHTPEFEFEKNRQNVVEAARTHGLEYPIAQDNNYATWNAYFNTAWPAKYLIDQNGDVRYLHLGEGAYAETEQVMRELLGETGVSLEDIDANLGPEPQFDQEAFAADPAQRLTRELYAGYERNHTLPSSAFATLVGTTPSYIMHEEYYQQKDADIFYQDPGEHFNHFIYLQGMWHNGPQSLTHARGTEDYEDYIAIKFYATSVNAVMSQGQQPCRGARPCAPTEVRITLDGRPLTPSQAGEDVKFDSQGNSYVLVDQSRMYRLVELPEFSSHDLKLSTNSANFSLFTFTFGAYAEGP
jgi:thiol-disulfide isomerase/thioredoxin